MNHENLEEYEDVLALISDKKHTDFKTERELRKHIRSQLLTHGVKIGDKRVTMRKQKVRDQRMVSEFKTPEEKEINLVANLTGLTVEEIDDLEMEQYICFQMGLGVA